MADSYAKFSESEDGRTQHRLIWDALSPYFTSLPANSKILDAGCGDGWLAGELSRTFPSVTGVDISADLIREAQQKNPTLKFLVHDLSEPLPFENNNFDAAVMNMVLHNIENQQAAADNIAQLIKPDGLLMIVMPNPYYAFPVAKWKKSIFAKLFGRNPRMVLSPYANFLRGTREFFWTPRDSKEKIPARFSSLPEQLNNLLNSGFALEKIHEIISNQDSKEFSLEYKSARYPLFLVLVLKKLG